VRYLGIETDDAQEISGQANSAIVATIVLLAIGIGFLAAIRHILLPKAPVASAFAAVVVAIFFVLLAGGPLGAELTVLIAA